MPKVPLSDVLASLAIITSLITYVYSQRAAKSLETRQQAFELRVYTLTMLDPARGTLQRILSDINRILNAAILRASVGGEEFSEEDLAALAKLDKEAIDTLNAISHHLSPNERQALEKERKVLEQKWMKKLPFNPREAYEHTEKMLKAVEARLQEILGVDQPT